MKKTVEVAFRYEIDASHKEGIPLAIEELIKSPSCGAMVCCSTKRGASMSYRIRLIPGGRVVEEAPDGD